MKFISFILGTVRIPRKDVIATVESMDTDNDGYISVSELVGLLKHVYKLIKG